MEETKGLSDVKKKQLLDELHAICEKKKGEVVIYDLAQAVEAFLHAHNKQPMQSFYHEMIDENNKRDEALSQQEAQRLILDQRAVRDEMMKAKQILKDEDRMGRESRRSLTEQSPKHRANSVELPDSPTDRTYPNNCIRHSNRDYLLFPNVNRKILRGCCLGK